MGAYGSVQLRMKPDHIYGLLKRVYRQLPVHRAFVRRYPYGFGLRVLRVLPQHQATGCKTLPPRPESFDPLEWYTREEFSDIWWDAGMDQVLTYLYGNKSLQIPIEWKRVLFAPNV